MSLRIQSIEKPNFFHDLFSVTINYILSTYKRKTTNRSKVTVFIPGELYKTKVEVPVYLLNGIETARGNHGMGISYWSPGVKSLTKTTLPADTYVMCLGLEKIADRRKLRTKDASDLIATVPEIPSAIKKKSTLTTTRQQKEKIGQPVFELTLLHKHTMYVLVCSGHDTIKSMSDLFFEHVITD